MIDLLVALIGQKEPWSAGSRMIGGQEIKVYYHPAHDPKQWVKLGEDWVTGVDGTVLSKYASDPVGWLAQAGSMDPKADAVVLPVAVRIYTRMEQGPAFLAPDAERTPTSLERRRGEFSDEELAQFVQALAATEMVLERRTQGHVDLRWTVVIDPTPLRGYGDAPIQLMADSMKALTREASWENQAGVVSAPFWGSIAVYPGEDRPQDVGLLRLGGLSYTSRAPVVGVGLKGMRHSVSKLLAGMENLLDRRAIAQGWSSVGRLPWWSDAAFWKEMGQTAEPTSAVLAQRSGKVPGPGGVQWTAPMSYMVRAGLPASFRATANRASALWLSPSALAKATWELDGSGDLVAPGWNSTLGAPVPEFAYIWPTESFTELASDGTLRIAANSTEPGWVVSHSSGEPNGSVPLLRLNKALAESPYLRVSFKAQGDLAVPLTVAWGDQSIALNPEGARIAGGSALWIPGSAEPTTVALTLKRQGDAVGAPSINIAVPMEPGLSRASRIGGQYLMISDLVVEPATEAVAPTPAAAAPFIPVFDRAAPVDDLLRSLDGVQRQPTPEALKSVTTLTTHADPFVSASALWTIVLHGGEVVAPIIKAALEVGPFEHNRQAGAEIMSRMDFDLVRPLTTMMMAGDWSAREAQARALTRYAEKNSEAAVGLILLLTDPEPAVRLRAAQGLPLAGELAERRLLYAAVNDPSEMVRATAYKKLLRAPTASIAEEARRGIGDESATVRAAVYRGMGDLGQESVQATIKRGLTDRSVTVRAAAVGALAACPGPVTAEDIQAVASDPAPQIQSQLAALRTAKGIRG